MAPASRFWILIVATLPSVACARGEGLDGSGIALQGEDGGRSVVMEAGARSDPSGSGRGASCNDNGVLESSEECDGVALGGKTCASQTLGAMPVGSLECVHCKLDLSRCSSANGGNVMGTGGSVNGDVPGTGGRLGAGGLTTPP